VARTAAARRRRGGTRRGNGPAGGLLLAALLLGALAAGAWYFRGAFDGADDPPVAAPAPAPGKPAPEPAPDGEASDRFEFYDMLPDAEVDVPEQPRSGGSAGPPPVSAPGTYVIQAGAFPDFAEADKVKARLALLGVSSEIQTAEVNGGTFHRVRIGPIDNLDELNRLRARLQANGIESLVNQVGE